MKNLTFLILVFSFGKLYSQSVADCPSNLSIFAEFAKVKNYDSAYAPWFEVKNTLSRAKRGHIHIWGAYFESFN